MKKILHLFANLTAHVKWSELTSSIIPTDSNVRCAAKATRPKKAMQDHFNYHHLGKTSHKCLICNKPMATKACVERHMMRIHGEKKEKPRTHICEQCGKAFADKKILTQHEITHSGARPLSCDICQQTFKHKASLYTHRKRVHNIAIAKKVVEFMDTQNMGT
ncbi:unnamed protein product [Parnassius apollo]|uniref:(apollo) hypothetical protein n=1 Tax=Parnassius apollo TaxID=110799 RepID=A0A8S3XJS6_PARAO|nr:unnamed protein product [Parnassius apollo]